MEIPFRLESVELVHYKYMNLLIISIVRITVASVLFKGR